jgi:predicted RNase H-like nuclease (RuvC/YqgF family)
MIDMTTTKTATILQQFNEWRRTPGIGWREGPTSKEITAAIDAAVVMIERLEAAEKEVTHIKEVEFPRKVCAVTVGWETKCARLEQERETLQAKVEAMENERTIDEQRIADLMAELNRVGQENEELHAKIADMERQKPAMWANSSNIISARISTERGSNGDQHTCSETKTAYHDTPLYLAPGAKGE